LRRATGFPLDDLTFILTLELPRFCGAISLLKVVGHG
jgi:hypothetical protein